MITRKNKILLFLSFILAYVFIFEYGITIREEFPVYRVVVDPGHGGLFMAPQDLYGDKYDQLSYTYLDRFKTGATYRGMKEHIIMYQIALKVEKKLALLAPGGDYKEFYKILRKYTDDPVPRIVIISMITRPESYNPAEKKNGEDVNGAYRLFDYPSQNGIITSGRISAINAFKPELVVSLHCCEKAPKFYRGMNVVIAPPYSFFKKGLDHLQGVSDNRDFFYKSIYANWFTEDTKSSPFHWFLNDSAIYFSGFRLNRDNIVDQNKFVGYHYNMVGWNYAAYNDWPSIAVSHPDNSPYAVNLKNLSLTGKFWDRERSVYEEFRRGINDGGDNRYAGEELLKFINYSLQLKGIYNRDQNPGPPYISTWAVPIYINAISAYLELGYLNLSHHRYIFAQKQDEIAEGIAVGIYSLLTGIKLKENNFKCRPRGENIDWSKYRLDDGRSYFEVVTE